MTKHPGITASILELIGNTPLIKLSKITNNLPGKFFAKYEAFNPGHSMKDRIALHIIEKAEKNGLLKKGATIVETTSGNTGFSVAMVCILKGYKCKLAVNSKASPSKINMLKSMGAKVYVCPADVKPDDPRSYFEFGKRLHLNTPNSIYLNQYFNELNVDAHYCTTGPEIWEQTNGKITHFIAASGTGGTISGVSKYLKEQNPKIRVLGVDSYGSILKKYHETGVLDEEEIYPYKIEGLGKSIIPSSTKFELIDKFEKVTDQAAAYKARELAMTEGLFTGYTSGAVIQAAIQFAENGEFDNNSKVVLFLPDHGSRYMEKIYSDDWMKEQDFIKKQDFKQEKVEIVK